MNLTFDIDSEDLQKQVVNMLANLIHRHPMIHAIKVTKEL